MSRRGVVPPGSPQRTLVTALEFLQDLQHWVGADPRVALRILRVVLDVARDPLHGIGKPEPLRHDLSGQWSRRVDSEHRLIYRFNQSQIEFLSAYGHYGN